MKLLPPAGEATNLVHPHGTILQYQHLLRERSEEQQHLICECRGKGALLTIAVTGTVGFSNAFLCAVVPSKPVYA